MPDTHLITTTEAARRLHVSDSHVRRMVAAGKIPVVRVGNYNLIDPKDLEKVETPGSGRWRKIRNNP